MEDQAKNTECIKIKFRKDNWILHQTHQQKDRMFLRMNKVNQKEQRPPPVVVVGNENFDASTT